jgi:hypothetical protein
MNRGAGGNILERQSIANQNIRIGAGTHRRPNLQADRLKNVALLAISVMHQRNTRRAIRIVFDSRHAPWHSVLLALEIDETQLLLVSTAVMANGEIA